MTDKQRRFSEIHNLMAPLSIKERLELFAIEGEHLNALCNFEEGENGEIWDEIIEGEYVTARRKAAGDYEPPDDPDAWSGGFADNH